MAYYNIKTEATLPLVLRLRGGLFLRVMKEKMQNLRTVEALNVVEEVVCAATSLA